MLNGHVQYVENKVSDFSINVTHAQDRLPDGRQELRLWGSPLPSLHFGTGYYKLTRLVSTQGGALSGEYNLCFGAEYKFSVHCAFRG